MTISDEQHSEIFSQSNSHLRPTRRVTVPALEDQLYLPHSVLDHGFVRVIDYMGDDAAVVQAARVSYGAGTKTQRDDAGLINYLIKHRHTTPFEMCEIKLHVKLPIFVARQWIRHRTANVNEYSARYSIMDKEFYFPSADELRQQSSQNKQGSDGEINPSLARGWLAQALEESERDYGLYDIAIKQGIARELSRMVLPLNIYTQWYWKIDLHNLLHFLQLRADPHAQKEIRDYANVMLAIVEAWVPMVYEAFCEHRLNARTFSATQMRVMKRIAGHYISTCASRPDDIPKRDWNELKEAFG